MTGSDYVKANFNPKTHVFLFGQELNSVTYAICKADMLLQDEDKDPEGIKGGDKEHDKASTLSNDQHADKKFDYILSNPPYGVEWKKDKEAVDRESERKFSGRFGAGLPRISDGQFLFIQHAISKFKPKSEGGSNAAIITNGSPLFTGDAGSGESEIRRWILENDFLEAIVAMPEQLFFNTGIATYVWIFSNRKDTARRGKVHLIDARKIHTQLRHNFGAKRYEISEDDTKEIVGLYSAFKESELSKIFPTTAFAYREITIQRPLRLKFEIADESILRLKEHRDFLNNLPGKKSDEKVKAENKTWQKFCAAIYEVLESMRGKVYMSRAEFLKKLGAETKKRNLKITGKMLKTIWQEIGERDEKAEICLDEDGTPEADNELKDFERVPWGQDIKEYFKKEVEPYVPDAWIDESVRDTKDGKVGVVGYEIPFTRYFYKYKKPRKVEEIETDLKSTEEDILELMKEI
jgi:type I restriction enzyme M protein